MSDISMKFKKIIAIREAMVYQMDNCQEIKRLCTYNTGTPLSKYGFLKDGRKIEQQDVSESLIDKNIFPSLFDENLLEKDKLLVFVFPYKGDFDDELGESRIAIDILCPQDLNRLDEMGQERIFMVASFIADLFDDRKILKRDGSPLTHCKAKLVEFEVTKTDRNLEFVGLSMILTIKTSNLRVNNGRR